MELQTQVRPVMCSPGAATPSRDLRLARTASLGAAFLPGIVDAGTITQVAVRLEASLSEILSPRIGRTRVFEPDSSIPAWERWITLRRQARHVSPSASRGLRCTTPSGAYARRRQTAPVPCPWTRDPSHGMVVRRPKTPRSREQPEHEHARSTLQIPSDPCRPTTGLALE